MSAPKAASIEEHYAVFSVSGGKFHKLGTPFKRGEAWHPRATVCGLTLTPQNFFETEADADRHTGGRLAKHMCQHCARSA